MKKYILILLALLLVCNVSEAQKRRKYKPMWKPRHHNSAARSKHIRQPYYRYSRNIQEITIGAGANHFYGELGGANMIGSPKFNLRDFDVPAIRPVINIGYRYQFHRDWAVRADINAALLSGNDKYTEETFRQNRNLNFYSPLVEIAGRLEYIIDFTKPGYRYIINTAGYRTWAVSLYFFGGVSGFYFEPYGSQGSGWVRLKPLSTEGQGMAGLERNTYSNIQFGVPMGVGLRYVPGFNSPWAIGIEYSVRWTFTDYIDDASTSYVDPTSLRQYKGDLAVQMANPAIDNTPGTPLYASTRAGEQRGDPRDNDTFMYAMLSVYFKIEKGNVPIFQRKRINKIKCPTFNKKKAVKYKINTDCPVFKS